MKANPCKGGKSVPFLIRWPKEIIANMAINTLDIDLMPTLADIEHIAYNKSTIEDE
ncbi:MAG: hypothetical protein AAGA10_17620 [Bacteroidota bacterium]